MQRHYAPAPLETVQPTYGWAKIVTTRKEPIYTRRGWLYPKEKKIKLFVLSHMVCSGKHTVKL